MDKQQILNGALLLNGEDKDYQITVEGDRIITTVKWMNGVFFAPDSLTDEVKTFRYIVTLTDDFTWLEMDESIATKKKGGSCGFGVNRSMFKGKQLAFDFSVGVGKDRKDGSVGVVKSVFNSEEYKKPVRDYLLSCGCKKSKKGFLANLFK